MYKSLKGLDSSILCGCPLTQERERTTIVGWRLFFVFPLHRSRLWGDHIGSLEWLQFHSISLALTLLGARFRWRIPVYTVVPIESICFLLFFPFLGYIALLGEGILLGSPLYTIIVDFLTVHGWNLYNSRPRDGWNRLMKIYWRLDASIE